MTSRPEDWTRIRIIFESVLSIDSELRGAHIEAACEGDEGLRKQVETLLASHEAAKNFLATSAALTTIARTPPGLEGCQLGPYVLVSRLATGGMGEVYKAQDTRLDRMVAIKLLPADAAGDATANDRFKQEARAVAALNHPHICTLYDVGEAPSLEPGNSESIRFLVMEYVEGTTLDLADELPLDSARVARIAAQVCDALEAAHARGIVHRDIKPLNIMLTPQGQVKVLDFGVAKRDLRGRVATDATQSGMKTATGVIVGTLAYMSPEQACGESVTGASDIFSLGVVLYRLATGRHPFVPDEPQGVVRALLTRRPLPLHRFNDAIPTALEALILQMLEKDPARRPDAVATRSAMIEIATSAGSAVRGLSPPRRRHTVGRRSERTLLEQALAAAATGHPQLVSVSGEPGMGKTTFIDEFLADVRSRGAASVAYGRCSERLAGSEAYLPVLEMLEHLVSGDDRYSGAQELMFQVAPTWYAQVTPAHRSVSAGVGAQLELRTASQERMKRELRAFLDDFSRASPLIIFLDDIHWSDLSTVDVLGYLCRQFGSMRLLIVVAYRPTDLLLAKHPFAALKLDLTAQGVCRELPLGFLTLDESAEYLDLEYPGHRFPPELASVIHQKTEGSPLFMADLVRDLRDRQIVVAEESGWTLAQSIPAIERDLPESVRSMIERKIGQLSDEDRQLLVCAAVQGHTFDSAVVAKVLERDPAETEERLEILDRVYAFIRAQGEVTLPDGTAAVRCRFVHVLYQNALYALVRATRRSSLSAMVANALIQFHGSENTSMAAELAVLLEVARDQRAARYFLLASQNALRVFAFVEAAAIANRGLALLLTQPDTRDRSALELKLQLALGTAFVAIKGYSAPDVERAYGRARDLCHQVGDSVELASVLFGLVVHYAVVPSHATSLNLGDEMLALADRENQAAARVQGLLTHGITRAWMGDVEEAVARLEQGITLYEARRPSFSGETPLFDYGVGCRRYQAVALWLLGYPERAVIRAEEAVADARRLKHPLTLASTLSFVSLLHYFRRDIPASLDAAAEASACTREYVLTFWLGFSNALHGWGVAHLADASGRPSEWDEGVAQIRENLEALRGAGARSFGSIGQALLAETYMLRERFDEAASALDEGLDLAAQVQEGLWEAELHRLRGELSLRRGSEGEAVVHFDRAIAMARHRKQRSLELRALISLYRLACSQADLKGRDRIRMQLAQTSDSFTEGFDTPDLVEARALVVGP